MFVHLRTMPPGELLLHRRGRILKLDFMSIGVTNLTHLISSSKSSSMCRTSWNQSCVVIRSFTFTTALWEVVSIFAESEYDESHNDCAISFNKTRGGGHLLAEIGSSSGGKGNISNKLFSKPSVHGCRAPSILSYLISYAAQLHSCYSPKRMLFISFTAFMEFRGT